MAAAKISNPIPKSGNKGVSNQYVVTRAGGLWRAWVRAAGEILFVRPRFRPKISPITVGECAVVTWSK